MLPLTRDDATGQPGPGPLRLICYPRDDDALGDRVRSIVDEGATLGRVVTPHQVADRLRAWYPHIAISVREPLADLWRSPEPTWYVYRDGSILPDRRADATSV